MGVCVRVCVYVWEVQRLVLYKARTGNTGSIKGITTGFAYVVF